MMTLTREQAIEAEREVQSLANMENHTVSARIYSKNKGVWEGTDTVIVANPSGGWIIRKLIDWWKFRHLRRALGKNRELEV